VTILGSHFLGASAVTFGGKDAQWFTVDSDSSITAYSPLLAAGTVDVQVTTPSSTSSATSADHYTYNNVTASTPAVTSLDVSSGSTAGGRVVVIKGTNFAGTTAVKFGTTNASAFSIDADTQITATAPAGSAGTVDITVTTNNGTSSTGSADQFTYVS